MCTLRQVCTVENEDGTRCQFETGDRIVVTYDLGRKIEDCEVIAIEDYRVRLEPFSGEDEGVAHWYDYDCINHVELYA